MGDSGRNPLRLAREAALEEVEAVEGLEEEPVVVRPGLLLAALLEVAKPALRAAEEEVEVAVRGEVEEVRRGVRDMGLGSLPMASFLVLHMRGLRRRCSC